MSFYAAPAAAATSDVAVVTLDTSAPTTSSASFVDLTVVSSLTFTANDAYRIHVYGRLTANGGSSTLAFQVLLGDGTNETVVATLDNAASGGNHAIVGTITVSQADTAGTYCGISMIEDTEVGEIVRATLTGSINWAALNEITVQGRCSDGTAQLTVLLIEKITDNT